MVAESMTWVQAVLVALCEGLLGDPHRVPHPVTGIARLGLWLHHRLRSDSDGRTRGILVMLLLCAVVSGVLFLAFLLLPEGLVTVIAVWSALAIRSMIDHFQAVERSLLQGSLADARRAVGAIVGRDVDDLDDKGVRRAALESLAESLVDGVIAPLFWYAIGGVYGLWIYKTTNTMDSMTGYRSKRWKQAGWAAARLDDLLNWLPARLTPLLLAVMAPLIGLSPLRLRGLGADRGVLTSPNAWLAEGAFARLLAVRLVGPARYQGILLERGWLNTSGREPDANTSRSGVWLFVGSSVLSFFLAVAIRRYLGQP